MAKKPKNKTRSPQNPAAAAPAAAPASGRRTDGKSATAATQIAAPAVEATDTFALDSVPDIAVDAPTDGPVAGFNLAGSDAAASRTDSTFEVSETESLPTGGAESAQATEDTFSNDASETDQSAPGGFVPTPVAEPVAARPLDMGSVEVFDSGVDGGNPDDIRGVLIQLANARLLLPNATIAEVLSYAEPDAIEGAPDWLLGRIRWRGWQLPLIAFARLAGISSERGGLGSKVVVLKALGTSKTPYFAVLTQGFPRLVTVSRAALMVDEGAVDLPEGILAHVTLNRDDAYVPDLERLEAMIGEALAQAA